MYVPKWKKAHYMPSHLTHTHACMHPYSIHTYTSSERTWIAKGKREDAKRHISHRAVYYNNALDTFTSIATTTTIQTYTFIHWCSGCFCRFFAFSLSLCVCVCVVCIHKRNNSICSLLLRRLLLLEGWRKIFTWFYSKRLRQKFRYSWWLLLVLLLLLLSFSFLRARSLVRDRVKCLLRFSIHISSAFAFDNNQTQWRTILRDFCILFIY